MARSGLLLGMDLGTTNAKVAAYAPDGKLHSRAVVEYPTFFPSAGRAEQRPEDWIGALSEATHEVMKDLVRVPEPVLGLSISAHGPGLVLVDERGESLTETIPTWQDERCYTQGERLIQMVGPDWIGLGMPLGGFPAKLLWAVDEEPELSSKARFALTIKDYLIGWLTGRYVTDPSSGPGNMSWWEPVFDAIGWSLDRLPQISASIEIAGEVLPEVAKSLGLPSGLPIVTGMNDGAATTLSSGAIRPGDAIVTLATNGVARLVISKPIDVQTRLDRNLFCWPYIEGNWIVGGQSKAGASSLQWYRDLIFDEQNDEAFHTLSKEANERPVGASGVVFLPYLMGRGSPNNDPDAKGALLGLTLAVTRGDIARGILEGVSFAIRDIVGALSEFDLQAQAIRLTGGGAQSEVWRQIISDVLDLPVQYTDVDATLGAAINASVGIGIYRAFHEAVESMCRTQTVTVPRQENADTYAELYSRYKITRDDVLRDSVGHDKGESPRA
jgi:xylulokinase